jgi:hypothetical protein
VIDFQLYYILLGRHSEFLLKKPLKIGFAYTAKRRKPFYLNVLIQKSFVYHIHSRLYFQIVPLGHVIIVLKLGKYLVKNRDTFEIISVVSADPSGEQLFEKITEIFFSCDSGLWHH